VAAAVPGTSRMLCIEQHHLNYRERPLTPTSRSCQYWTLHILETAKDTATVAIVGWVGCMVEW